MAWSSTILVRRAPTKESPAPVVSTVFTWNAATLPWNFYAPKKEPSHIIKPQVSHVPLPHKDREVIFKRSLFQKYQVPNFYIKQLSKHVITLFSLSVY